MRFHGAIAAAAHGAVDVAPPVCARCRKSVDVLRWSDDPITNERVFLSECHGEHELHRVSLFTLATALPGSFRFGVAFATPPAVDPAPAKPPRA